VPRDVPCRIASAHQSEDILLKFAARAAGYVFGWCGTYEPLERPLASETTRRMKADERLPSGRIPIASTSVRPSSSTCATAVSSR